MDTVFLRSGKVVSLLGSGVTGTAASVTASIADTVLTVTVVGSGKIFSGTILTGTGIPTGTYVIDQLSGTTGGVGTYRINQPVTFASGAVTGATSSEPKYKDSPWSTFQAIVTGTSGAVTATVVVDGSNDGVNWCSTPIGTITLSGTISASDGFTTVAPWKFVRARITAISGTNATVTFLMGI